MAQTLQVWKTDLTCQDEPALIAGYEYLNLSVFLGFMGGSAQKHAESIAGTFRQVTEDVDTRRITRYEVRNADGALVAIYTYRIVEDPDDKLDTERNDAADAAFRDYDFDPPVKDYNNWDETDNEYTRTVFLEGEGDEPSARIRFRVRFKPGSADLDEVCIL